MAIIILLLQCDPLTDIYFCCRGIDDVCIEQTKLYRHAQTTHAWKAKRTKRAQEARSASVAAHGSLILPFARAGSKGCKGFFTAAVGAVKENTAFHPDPTQQQGLATISDGIVQCTHCILTP